MRIRWLISSLVLGALITLTPASDAASPQSGVAVHIEAEGNRYETLPLLPVALMLRLTNDGPTTVAIRGWDEESSSPATFQFLIGDERGAVRRAMFADLNRLAFIADEWDYHPRNVVRQAAPHETRLVDYCLGYAAVSDGATTRKLAVFPAPGRYSVRLEMPFLVPGGAISNEITITVRPPDSPADRRAYEILRASSQPTILLPLPEYGSPLLREVVGYPISDEAAKVAAMIVTQCPGSGYVPYAQLLLATALSESTVPTTAPGRLIAPDLDRQVEGIRMLRQLAVDPRLPRRHREAALCKLTAAATSLYDSLKYQSARTAPSLEAVIGGPKVDLGLPPVIVYQIAYDIVQGKANPGFEKLLRSKLTADQFDAVIKAVTSNPDVARSAGVNPLQQELRGDVEWARSELRKLPWRDPLTLKETFRAAPLGSE